MMMGVESHFLKASKAWLAPLIVILVIFIGLFVLVHGPIDIPFLYRSQ
jgi:hypothetical protein